ncbi:hypothetical protein B0A81_20685 [Flavobacterium plurextorum]|uniref:PH domain-containing protein n=1 Tax=Flavobacterium plurextorum TaxID=1114867 RepID=A0ABX4CQ26_9FLAO|nr:hypothetical protein [Flavobacterium plurextorum]OXB00594.1 hypothetical protein B0A81_20685 [Flavobacterium plurextorum]
MKKKQLSSKFTFLKKYILPIWMIIAGIFMLYTTILSKNWFMVIVILFVINGMVYTARKFLFPLRNVFLDKENRKMIIEYKKEMIAIPISDIKKVEEQNILGKVLNIRLSQNSKFGTEIIFVPKNDFIIREIIELKNMSQLNEEF